ncbi:hypothetical protein B0O99DRAFT_601750 [Bisporella sp. PMI_857]|nr:hypothetical protein B0O99DRAFT_601750 [Bisporella sp. PMI_857]
MGSSRDTIQVLNQKKLAEKDALRRVAVEGKINARKKVEEKKKAITEKNTSVAELERLLAAATSESEKEAKKKELEKLQSEINNDDSEMRDAEEEEKKFATEEKDADMMDVYDDQEIKAEHDSDDDLNLAESTDEMDRIGKMLRGARISEKTETIEIQAIGLGKGQAIIGYKGGIAKKVIIVDRSVPKREIFRMRTGVEPPANCPDIINWRRAGKVKNRQTKEKWNKSDIAAVLGVVIEIPPKYKGNPEDLVRLIKPLTNKEVFDLKEKGKPIPKQPEVQLFLQWKLGMIPEGEEEEVFISYESRSGCRTIFKKTADQYLFEKAKEFEEAYRNAEGRTKSEIRTMSPVSLPSTARNTPEDDSGSEGEEELEQENKSEEKKTEEKKKGEKKTEEKNKGEKKDNKLDADAYGNAWEDYEAKYRARKRIGADVELSPTQEADLAFQFDYLWTNGKLK